MHPFLKYNRSKLKKNGSPLIRTSCRRQHRVAITYRPRVASRRFRCIISSGSIFIGKLLCRRWDSPLCPWVKCGIASFFQIIGSNTVYLWSRSGRGPGRRGTGDAQGRAHCIDPSRAGDTVPTSDRKRGGRCAADIQHSGTVQEADAGFQARRRTRRKRVDERLQGIEVVANRFSRPSRCWLVGSSDRRTWAAP